MPEDIFWQEMIHDVERGSIVSIEDAARQLVTINSLLATIYFAVVSFTNLADGFATKSYSALGSMANNLTSMYSIGYYNYYSLILSQNDVILTKFIYKCILIILFASPILIWLTSLYFVANVLKPEHSNTDYNSPNLSRRTYRCIVKRKYDRLKKAYRFLYIGFIVLFLNIVVYLVLTL